MYLYTPKKYALLYIFYIYFMYAFGSGLLSGTNLCPTVVMATDR